MCHALKTLAWMLWILALAVPVLSHAVCPTHLVVVKGRVRNARNSDIVRVQLVYAKQQIGDSADVTVEGGSFTLQVPFYTQSRKPVLFGTWREKCDRKPETVIVTLMEGDHEEDRISLDLAKDFTMPYPSAYMLRSEIVLHGPLGTH